MKINKVTDIAIKPSAEGILARMQAQLDNPKSKQKWDSPFKKKSGIGKNALTGNYYKGSNLMLTMFDSEKNKYAHAIYATKKQWATLKCEVKDNAPSLPILKTQKELKEKKFKQVLFVYILGFTMLSLLRVITNFQLLKLVNSIQLN